MLPAPEPIRELTGLAPSDLSDELLSSSQCAFVVVTAPGGPSLAEAGYFLDRLDAGGMRAAAVVVNRSHPGVRLGSVRVDAIGALETATRLEPSNYVYYDLLMDMYTEFGAEEKAAESCRP